MSYYGAAQRFGFGDEVLSRLSAIDPFGLLAHQNAAQIMHRQKQAIGEILEILIIGAGLRPMCRFVEMVDGAVNVIEVTALEQGAARLHPLGYGGGLVCG